MSDLPPLLFVAHRVPYPPDKGDRIRSFHLLRWLSRHADVYLACLADEKVSEQAVAVLQGLCKGLAIEPLAKSRWLRALGTLTRGRTVTEGAFRSPALQARIQEWARAIGFQAVLLSSSCLAPYLDLPELEKMRAVIDLMDVDSQKWLDYAENSRGPWKWLYRTEGHRLRQLERGLTARATALTLVSQAEVELFRQFSTAGVVQAVANGVDLEYFQPSLQEEEASCVFTGVLDYWPNVEGICWFCREVWPQVRLRRPQCRLYLVGRQPSRAVRALAKVAGVEVVGPVPDVRPHLAHSAVAIAPLRIARGVQNKVLEALAMGKAVVASPQSLGGLQVKAGTHLLAASSAGQWSDGILRLLDDQGLRRELGTAGRRFVEEHHHWETCLQPFPTLLGLTPAGSLSPVAAERGMEKV